MPRILDTKVISISRKPQEISSELSNDAHVSTSYELVRNNDNYPMLIPLNHFTNGNTNNNKNTSQLAPSQAPRQDARRPSNLLTTFSPPSPVAPAATIRQQRQAWSPPLPTRDIVVNESKKTVFQTIWAAMTLGRLLFMLGGMILFAVPLAVVITLMVANASKSATTPATTQTTSGTNLATQCYAYTNIASDATRVYPYYSGSCLTTPSDSFNGWYRFLSTTGATRLLTTSFLGGCYCGGYYGGWWNGTLPMTVGQTNTGNVCFAYTSTNCISSSFSVSVTNCSGYYVNYLVAPSISYARYCTTAS